MVHQHYPDLDNTVHEGEIEREGELEQTHSNIITHLCFLFLPLKIHSHSGDWSSLHELIPTEHLPQELGGSLPPLDTFNADKLFAEELGHTPDQHQ